MTRIDPGTTLSPMAMGKRRWHGKQTSMCVAFQDLPRSAAHPFYTRLNQILDTWAADLEEDSRPSDFAYKSKSTEDVNP